MGRRYLQTSKNKRERQRKSKDKKYAKKVTHTVKQSYKGKDTKSTIKDVLENNRLKDRDTQRQ